MRLYGLIGFPLGHSFSKKYFSEKFEREKLDCRFENFPIESIELLPKLLEENTALQGLCVTIPYKEKIIPYLHEMSEEVQAIKACNSVFLQKGILKGFNTDTIGFKESLSRQLLPQDKTALILGTGGASKAVAFVLQKLGIEYQIVSRTGRAGMLTYEEVSPEVVKSHRLIINASPAGTFPHSDTYPFIPYEALSKHHFLFDLVYNPEKTIFLQKGAAVGARIQNGFDMLIGQAEASWRIWNERS